MVAGIRYGLAARPPDRALLAAVADEPEADPSEHVHGGAVIVEAQPGRDHSRMTGHKE